MEHDMCLLIEVHDTAHNVALPAITEPEFVTTSRSYYKFVGNTRDRNLVNVF